MPKKNKLKKALRNPKKYVKSKKVGYKGVAMQAKKRQMLKDAGKPPTKRKKKKK